MWAMVPQVWKKHVWHSHLSSILEMAPSAEALYLCR